MLINYQYALIILSNKESLVDLQNVLLRQGSLDKSGLFVNFCNIHRRSSGFITEVILRSRRHCALKELDELSRCFLLYFWRWRRPFHRAAAGRNRTGFIAVNRLSDLK